MATVFSPQTVAGILTKRTGKDVSASSVGSTTGAGTSAVLTQSSGRRNLSSSSLSLLSKQTSQSQTIQTQLQSAQSTHPSSDVPPPTLEQLQRLAHSLKEKSLRNNSKPPLIPTTAAIPYQPSTASAANGGNNNAANDATADVSDADAASFFNFLFDPLPSTAISSPEHSSESNIPASIFASCSPSLSVADLGSLTPADSDLLNAFELSYSNTLNSNRTSESIDGIKTQNDYFSTLYMPPPINSEDSPVASNLFAISSPDLFTTFSSANNTDWMSGSSLFLNDSSFELLNITQQIQADQMILDQLQPQDPAVVSMSQLNTFIAPTQEQMDDVAYFGLSDGFDFLDAVPEQEKEEEEQQQNVTVVTELNIQEAIKISVATPLLPPPQKRPRGRPRKIQPPPTSSEDTDKTPLASSSTKKRKPSSPIRPKLESYYAATQSPTFAKQEDGEEFDEISYYIQLAEAATSGKYATSANNANVIKPLLARPLNSAEAAKISLHSFRPSRPMDADLAREYLALKDPVLSAKERRQLRNKLSARSFRERRKEYIDTIEAELCAVVDEAVEARDALDGVTKERDMYRKMYEDLEARFASVKIEDESLPKQLEASDEKKSCSGSGNKSKSENSSNRNKFAGNCRSNANSATSTTTTSAVAVTTLPNRINLESNSICVHSVSVPEISQDVLQWLEGISTSMPAPTPVDSVAACAMKQNESVLYKKLQQQGELALSNWMFILLRQVQICAEEKLRSIVDPLDSEDVATLCGADDEYDDRDDGNNLQNNYDYFALQTETSAVVSILDHGNNLNNDDESDDDVSLFGDDQQLVVYDSFMREDLFWRLFQSLNLEHTPAFAVKQ
ncbi:hypothetical protein HK100_002697 [Physocladia obscura]|uniref:BZIP domain-containing protein n=1 Tax=Physocladia obscura TaxID=109957 RepID=A0AAD5SX61_9FUNG|nr:hypothetical protein HK100_002697 [Physocladia obscura]